MKIKCQLHKWAYIHVSVNPVLGKVAVTVWTFNQFLTLWRRIGFYMRHSSFSTMYWIASRHREIRLGFAGSTTHDDVFFMYLQGFKRGLQLRYGATTRSHNLSIFSVEDYRLVYKEWFLMMAHSVGFYRKFLPCFFKVVIFLVKSDSVWWWWLFD